jgi:hypothetical protein
MCTAALCIHGVLQGELYHRAMSGAMIQLHAFLTLMLDRASGPRRTRPSGLKDQWSCGEES